MFFSQSVKFFKVSNPVQGFTRIFFNLVRSNVFVKGKVDNQILVSKTNSEQISFQSHRPEQLSLLLQLIQGNAKFICINFHFSLLSKKETRSRMVSKSVVCMAEMTLTFYYFKIEKLTKIHLWHGYQNWSGASYVYQRC